jgi:hypothetical protein
VLLGYGNHLLAWATLTSEALVWAKDYDMFGSLHNGGKIGKTICTKNETLIKRLHHGWKIEEKSFNF